MNIYKTIMPLIILALLMIACDSKQKELPYAELCDKANLAIINRDKTKAELYLREMLKRQLRGDREPYALGIIYYRLGRITGNKKNYKEALKYFEPFLSTKNLQDFKWDVPGQCYLSLNKYSKAANCFQKALKTVQSHKQESMIDVIDLYYSLAVTNYRIGDLPKAESYAKKSVELSTEAYGSDALFTAGCKVALAQILYNLKRKEKAILILKNAYDIYRKSKPQGNKTVQQIKKKLKNWEIK